MKNLLFVVPVVKYSATNRQDPESKTVNGGFFRKGRISTGKIVGEVEDDGYLFLKGSKGDPIEVEISRKILTMLSTRSSILSPRVKNRHCGCGWFQTGDLV